MHIFEWAIYWEKKTYKTKNHNNNKINTSSEEKKIFCSIIEKKKHRGIFAWSFVFSAKVCFKTSRDQTVNSVKKSNY